MYVYIYMMCIYIHIHTYIDMSVYIYIHTCIDVSHVHMLPGIPVLLQCVTKERQVHVVPIRTTRPAAPSGNEAVFCGSNGQKFAKDDLLLYRLPVVDQPFQYLGESTGKITISKSKSS